MAIHLTRARPYAKAIFNLALEYDQLSLWQEKLDMLAAIAKEGEGDKLLDNPKIRAHEKIDFFIDIIGQVPEAISNLVKLLVERKKLFLLPVIAASYRQLFLTHNNILEAKIISAGELDAEQKEQLLRVLKQRYQREILLTCHVDTALIGGAVVYVEDRVIDGSIRGMLRRLKQNLLLKSTYAKTE